jgi:hypothetical protein
MHGCWARAGLDSQTTAVTAVAIAVFMAHL